MESLTSEDAEWLLERLSEYMEKHDDLSDVELRQVIRIEMKLERLV